MEPDFPGLNGSRGMEQRELEPSGSLKRAQVRQLLQRQGLETTSLLESELRTTTRGGCGIRDTLRMCCLNAAAPGPPAGGRGAQLMCSPQQRHFGVQLPREAPEAAHAPTDQKKNPQPRRRAGARGAGEPAPAGVYYAAISPARGSTLGPELGFPIAAN